MLVKKVRKLYDKKYDLNCAECILTAAIEEYELDIPQKSLKLMSAFGGGMGIGSVCGALTGGAAVLGIIFTEKRGHQSPQAKMITAEFIGNFKERLKVIDCVPLKENYFKGEERCIVIMETAAEELEKVICKYRDIYPTFK